MEGDAGTSRLIPDPETDTADGAQDAPDEASLGAPDTPPQEQPPAEPRRPSRLGTGWVATICVVLLLLGGGGITAGYLALRANARAAEVARSDDAALQAAKECVAATQAPDTAAMTAAQSKILECSTGEFGVQAGLFSSVLAEAYQAADATVAVDDLRAAVERRNEDGTVNVLVAVRVRISNSEAADQRVGYRLRATMAFDEGQYRISSLDQVNS
ncbi:MULTISPECIES: hypothetical protein [Mycolicibacterium]|jgi:Mce-associated membrane protein|uniref:Conserved MCE associated membrane protein n=2 Tax=Mycolicibacterium TaxID=1866885 RepID=A1T1E1_MYCVP|nr:MULTISPECIES: hypothetical protein [Mycolicibacterium]ABM10991.1 putative conserved MCE associated membrane protein [Mycolicibacterium vanbaalenii PYR-1]MCV7130698.1 hypothetical protein [Mycolicibacterium vanbaalenii PYR-1]MDN4516496.1 hypothetical protein [Mycolicibacterium austroafricanum]MDW5610120.1 hypothetical protein [Mycolicibacterium sp. D5.8-2]PQP46322.1 hypothetical protein C6A88_18195 [Mycolicibacterium austroafricanum]